jgi:hypothetical protein
MHLRNFGTCILYEFTQILACQGRALNFLTTTSGTALVPRRPDNVGIHREQHPHTTVSTVLLRTESSRECTLCSMKSFPLVLGDAVENNFHRFGLTVRPTP